jgi:hypothetical protein
VAHLASPVTSMTRADHHPVCGIPGVIFTAFW